MDFLVQAANDKFFYHNPKEKIFKIENKSATILRT